MARSAEKVLPEVILGEESAQRVADIVIAALREDRFVDEV